MSESTLDAAQARAVLAELAELASSRLRLDVLEGLSPTLARRLSLMSQKNRLLQDAEILDAYWDLFWWADRLLRSETWEDRKGNVIPVSEIDADYAANILRFLRNRSHMFRTAASTALHVEMASRESADDVYDLLEGALAAAVEHTDELICLSPIYSAIEGRAAASETS